MGKIRHKAELKQACASLSTTRGAQRFHSAAEVEKLWESLVNMDEDSEGEQVMATEESVSESCSDEVWDSFYPFF